ncbi:Hpt protein [Mizugakiibacter sediminis]|uniref:Flagellar secretion chaperone FliS n=1 Tax=Mizugakiibacter sediminis TaxID=1475481 RepID=A0A0K8QK82_9GAMM|nr:flagellar export chaperone FliS [Mizugakiibacter sediminis]GAP65253.1 Hpt protein [Mizugakiibacter sediminis]
MAFPNGSSAIAQYRQVGTRGSVEQADPHRLTAMLMEGALERITAAIGHMRRGEVARKGECISRAIAIVEGLRGSLDFEAGGALAGNLEALYEYMGRRLLQANAADDAGMLEEVAGLLREIKSAWDAIRPQALALRPGAAGAGA